MLALSCRIERKKEMKFHFKLEEIKKLSIEYLFARNFSLLLKKNSPTSARLGFLLIWRLGDGNFWLVDFFVR